MHRSKQRPDPCNEMNELGRKGKVAADQRTACGAYPLVPAPDLEASNASRLAVCAACIVECRRRNDHTSQRVGVIALTYRELGLRALDRWLVLQRVD